MVRGRGRERVCVLVHTCLDFEERMKELQEEVCINN